MQLIGREAPVDGTPDQWATLPFDKDWEDARQAGIDIAMVGLRCGAFVLALFPGEPQPGTVFAIGLTVSQDELAAIKDRLPEGSAVLESDDESLGFVDRHGFHWQLSTSHEFSTAGVFAGRWLDA